MYMVLSTSVRRESTRHGLQVPEAHNLKLKPAHSQLSLRVSEPAWTTSTAWATMCVAMTASSHAVKAGAFQT